MNALRPPPVISGKFVNKLISCNQDNFNTYFINGRLRRNNNLSFNDAFAIKHLAIPLLLKYKTKLLTLGRTCKLIPPPWYKGFAKRFLRGILQNFGYILRLIDSLWCALQDKVNITVFGTAGGP